MGTLTLDVAVTGCVDFTDDELDSHTKEAVVREHLHGLNPDWSIAEGITIHELAVNDRRTTGKVFRERDAGLAVAFMLTLHAEGLTLSEAVDAIRENLSRDYQGDPEPGLGDAWYPDHTKVWGLRLDGRHRPMLVFAHGDDNDPDTPAGLNVDLTDMAEPHACDTCRDIYDEACGEGYCGDCPECADKAGEDEDEDD